MGRVMTKGSTFRARSNVLSATSRKFENGGVLAKFRRKGTFLPAGRREKSRRRPQRNSLVGLTRSLGGRRKRAEREGFRWSKQ